MFGDAGTAETFLFLLFLIRRILRLDFLLDCQLAISHNIHSSSFGKNASCDLVDSWGYDEDASFIFFPKEMVGNCVG